MHRFFSVLVNVAIVNCPDKFKLADKKSFAKAVLMKTPGVKTVLEKSHKFSGRLRKMQTKHILGEKTKEVLYRENGCVFRFNIDDTYFSPRLSNERKEMASVIKKGDNVLVMFAGVAPFSIVIGKNSLAKRIVSNEINRKANKYAQLNLELNKLKKKIELMPGDVKRLVSSGQLKEKFDVIVMARPNLKDSFLVDALKVAKKGTKIIYYGFCRDTELKKMVSDLKEEAKGVGKKLKVLRKKEAGNIALYKYRYRIEMKVI